MDREDVMSLKHTAAQVRTGSLRHLPEEAPGADKAVEVVRVGELAGLSRVVARMRSAGVVEG